MSRANCPRPAGLVRRRARPRPHPVGDAGSASVVSSTPASWAASDRADPTTSPSARTRMPSASSGSTVGTGSIAGSCGQPCAGQIGRLQVDVGGVEQVRFGGQRIERVERCEAVRGVADRKLRERSSSSSRTSVRDNLSRPAERAWVGRPSCVGRYALVGDEALREHPQGALGLRLLARRSR